MTERIEGFTRKKLEINLWIKIIRQIENIVSVYDRVARIISLGLADKIRRKALIVSSLLADERRAVVDVGCGPGTSVREILRLVVPKYIICVDPSIYLLEFCMQKFRVERIYMDFVVGVAEYMPIRDRAVDVVTVFYAARDFSDPQRGFKELLRISRCSIAIGDIFLPDDSISRVIVKTWICYFVPLIVDIVAFGHGKDYRGICDSLNGWYSLEKLKEFFLKLASVKAMYTRSHALGGIGYAVIVKDTCRLKWS